MQINISVRRGDLSDAAKEKITQKVEKLQRYFERLTSIEVIIDLSTADEPKVDIAVTAEHKQDFAAQFPAADKKELTSSVDLFGAVDHAIAKLEQQIKKYKEKIQNRS
ncbi:MAG: ribosome-associated translation inhibitor RaiA [Planctomycetaceae bacterium]|nr:ribosome-associated translation inhibitor RaiA [Planctomycetaceae bacterium]